MNTQEAQKIVQNLIKGSQEIDRMRKEVDCVVKMIIGFVDLYHCSWEDYRRERFFLSNSKYCWEIFMNPRPKGLEVKFLYIEDESSPPRCLFYCGQPIFFLNQVKIVYDALPVFVKGMVRMFPDLQNRWQPLLDAAEAAEK